MKKKALTDTMIASKLIKAKRKYPNRPQENPNEIKEIQEKLRKASVPSKQSTNWLSAQFIMQRIQTDTVHNTTYLIIGACLIV